MMTTRFLRYALPDAALAVTIAACAPRGPGAAPPVPAPAAPPPGAASAGPAPIVRAPLPEATPGLPPVPHVAGPLQIKVVYPTAGQLIQSKDSNFIFGSIGNGDAALTINSVPTPVWANGAFMGWLANPSPDLSRYDLVATSGADTARLSLAVKLQPPPTVPPTPGDTLHIFSRAQYAALIGPATVSNDTDRVVTAYALTGGIQRWFLIPGTVVKVVSIKGPDAFVELDSTQTVLIARTDLNMTTPTPGTPPLVTTSPSVTVSPSVATPAASAPPVPMPVASAPAHPASFAQPSRTASAFRVVSSPEWTDVVIPISERPAYLVDETMSSITLTLYGTAGSGQLPITPPAPSYLTAVSSATAGPQMRYSISLRGPVYGYQPLWQDSVFTLRVRRPPAVDPVDPLRGLTIAIDPGHPPVGATGPTGLWEPVATLAVGLKVRDLLAARGVNVLMTRTDSLPVDLNLRPTMARRANAHALVSIHLNAVPDGMNPFTSEGTTTYHYWIHSEPLASATHKALLARLSLPDRGVKRENFALVRPTWMPAILCEGAFIIMPDQEAALRTPEYQERYARGIVEGLGNYFRSLGQAAH